MRRDRRPTHVLASPACPRAVQVELLPPVVDARETVSRAPGGTHPGAPLPAFSAAAKLSRPGDGGGAAAGRFGWGCWAELGARELVPGAAGVFGAARRRASSRCRRSAPAAWRPRSGAASWGRCGTVAVFARPPLVSCCRSRLDAAVSVTGAAAVSEATADAPTVSAPTGPVSVSTTGGRQREGEEGGPSSCGRPGYRTPRRPRVAWRCSFPFSLGTTPPPHRGSSAVTKMMAAGEHIVR